MRLHTNCIAALLMLVISSPTLHAKELAVGLLTQADDERYSASRLEKSYPDEPSGRAEQAVRLALEDTAFTLQSAGYSAAKLVLAEAPDSTQLAAVLDALVKSGVKHIVLELPAASVALVAVAAQGRDVLLLNAAAPQDTLRAASCAPNLLHTLPSQAMQSDATAQLLAVRKWDKLLVLYGPTAQDQLLLAAYQRSARRFGLKTVALRPFKLSNDPRERALGNVRLLTASADYDAVMVLDADGEFARDLPYRSVLPRPVLGSNGLTAQAWSAWYERNGAPQINRRFFKRSGRAMGSYDWAAWIAARAIVEAVAQDAKASNTAAQLKALKQGSLALDGYKGQRLSFRAWDGQLRQPLLLVHSNGLADTAPFEGFLHPRTVLDTLGFDVAETGCKAP